MIKVLVAENSLPLNSAQFDYLSYCLPSPVIDFAKKYRRWQDANAFLLGRYLLIEGLKFYGFEKNIFDINYTKYNRPYLSIPLDFNISHSGNYILCALSTNNIGIDIEVIRPLEINDFAHCFSADELLKINCAPDRHIEFFKHWTIKEAVIKADGRGFSIPLETIIISDKIVIEGNTWFIHKIEIDPCYQSHLATNEILDQSISIERISLPNDKE